MKMQLIVTAEDPTDVQHLEAIVRSVSALLSEGKKVDTKLLAANGGTVTEIKKPSKKKDEEDEVKPAGKKRGPKPKALKIVEEDDEDDEDDEDESDEVEDEEADDADEEDSDEDDEEEEPVAKKKPAKKEGKASKETKYTADDILNLFRKFKDKHGKPKAAKVLASLGVKAVPEIAPEDYTKAVKLLKAQE